MILNTNTLISSNFPLESIRTITNSYVERSQDTYLTINKDVEVPLFTINPNKLFEYDYTGSGYRVKSYDNFLTCYTVPIKVLGDKFYTCFKSLGALRAYTVSNQMYYIGKGIITDKNFNPLIMTTYKVTDTDLGIINSNPGNGTGRLHVVQDNVTIYLSREIYSDRFREENKRLYKELFTVIIPLLMSYDIKIVIKKELNMFMTTFVDPRLSNSQLQDRFKIQAQDAKTIITQRLS